MHAGLTAGWDRDNPINALWWLLVGSPQVRWSDNADGQNVTLVNSYWSFSFSADGAFFAPFWGMFDMWYSPDNFSDLRHSSMFTPLVVWCYLLVNLILFVNV